MNSFPFHQPSRMKRCRVKAAALGLVMITAVSYADWPDTNATKWVQFPDIQRGLDVLAAQPQVAGTENQPIILADDFKCIRTGPISDIHLWTSWLGDQPNPDLPITLGIWSDVPATNNAAGGRVPSHPGDLLWSQRFLPGQYAIRAWKSADERFWNPDLGEQGILGGDFLIWQYNFYPKDPFTQRGTPDAPAVYWLSVTAGTNTVLFGWKSSTNHWNDDAVFGHLDPRSELPLNDWKELLDPRTPSRPQSLDLSFALTTVLQTPPPPPPTHKWAQYPDLQKGLDVNATVPGIVADDFLCRTAGALTNIQVWGSWQQDADPDPNTVFVVGIWSDLPATGSANYSRPGRLLWREIFTPGTYSVTSAGEGTEQFYDPDNGALSPERRVWLYNFDPQRPFCQRGSTNQPVIYWLTVSARTSAGDLRFGWKTSTNHWNDDSVYGHLDTAGNAAGDWRELFDLGTGNSLDQAFVISSGPPGPDCDPQRGPKFLQRPDASTNGLDVLDTAPEILADDFLCKLPGAISGVTVWGSWLQDQVDTNALFKLSLWTDVPAVPGSANQFSHPGKLLCEEWFYPPWTTEPTVQRYKYRLDTDKVRETFYNPDSPDQSGFIGNDSQIWRYDFFPTRPCWRQNGRPTSGRVYWLGLAAITTNQFGWKTSINHWNDDAVSGHLDANYGALGDWKDMHDPRSGKSLDLSFALRRFPVVSLSKDLRNNTPTAANGLRIVLAGTHEITRYNFADAWPKFHADYLGGNTVLQWSGMDVAPGAMIHVGFEMAGTEVRILSMAWLAGNTVIGLPIQLNHHLYRSGNTLVVDHDLGGVGNDFIILINGYSVEYYSEPVPLDMLNSGATRNPLATMMLEPSASSLMPGAPLVLSVSPGPPDARYAVVIGDLADGSAAIGIPTPKGLAPTATMDFYQFPLDAALQPIIESIESSEGNATITWASVPGRSYRLQSTGNLGNPTWTDVEEVEATDVDASVTLPGAGDSAFYRVYLVPE